MNQELKFAIETAKQAGKIIMSGLARVKIEGHKAEKQHIITNIDLEAEKVIIERIKQNYPEHQIYSEECGRIKEGSDYIWLIDPLCGTKYFAKGIKLFNVSIALWKGDEPILGVVHLPAVGDTYWAEKGRGAFCNNKRIKVSDIDRLDESRVCLAVTGSNRLTQDEYVLVNKRLELILRNLYRFHAFGFGGALCFIAHGGLEAFFDLTGKEDILDMAAGMVIAKEAGAKVTGLDGKFHGQDTSHLVITNGKIHDDFLKLLNEPC